MADPGPVQATLDITSGNIAVVDVRGDVGTHEATSLRTVIKQAYDRRPARIVVDLSGVTYMATAGLATLVEAMQLSKRTGTPLVLSGLQERVRAVFEISRLTNVFAIVETRAQAVGTP